MSNQESTVFKIGDVVSLKVQPEFRGVIQMFLDKNNNRLIPETSLDAQQYSHAWVNISSVDADYQTKFILVPILHLKFPE